MSRARYIMTAKRRAALRKAQLASARKRRGKMSRRKKAAVAGGVTVGVLGAGVARHKISGSKISVRVTSARNKQGDLITHAPGAKGYVRTSKGLDASRRPVRVVTVATRPSRSNRRGVSIPRALMGYNVVRGRRMILTYEHKSVFGKKTKSVAKYSDARSNTPNISNSINWRIANDPVWNAKVKGKNPPGGNAKSRVITKKMRQEWVRQYRAQKRRQAEWGSS